jgi:hypothetical protein
MKIAIGIKASSAALMYELMQGNVLLKQCRNPNTLLVFSISRLRLDNLRNSMNQLWDPLQGLRKSRRFLEVRKL